MFWIAIFPALLTLWIRSRVPESPVWLERQQRLKEAARTGQISREPKVSLVRIFQRDLIGTTIQTSAVIGAFMCIYYSVNYWYPTVLREAGRLTLPYLAAFNIGAIVGTASWGRRSETALGRRGAVSITVVLGIASLPFYLHATSPFGLGVGALMMGMFGMGIWGMAPAYTTERFPTSVRGVGPGFCYHAGAAIGAFMPPLVGALADRGVALVNAMSFCMVISGLLSGVLIWLGRKRAADNSGDPTWKRIRPIFYDACHCFTHPYAHRSRSQKNHRRRSHDSFRRVRLRVGDRRSTRHVCRRYGVRRDDGAETWANHDQAHRRGPGIDWNRPGCRRARDRQPPSLRPLWQLRPVPEGPLSSAGLRDGIRDGPVHVSHADPISSKQIVVRGQEGFGGARGLHEGAERWRRNHAAPHGGTERLQCVR